MADDLFVTFAAPIAAADPGRRTVTGTVLPYGAVGTTSLGPVRFARGAFGDALDPAAVRLLLEHDRSRPIGRALELVESDAGIVGTFRLSTTTAAGDALIEAADGLRDGLSIGARLVDYTIDDDGTIHATAAELREVSLVTDPAFGGARVAEVAASAIDAATTPTPTPTATTEPDHHRAPTEARPMDEPTNPEATEVAASEPATTEVAAAAPEPASPTPQVTARDRDPAPISAGQTVQLMVAASQGDPAAGELLRAATGTTQVSGLIPTPQAREIIGIIDQRRPVVDTVERRALPASGVKFQVPVRLTKSGVELIDNPDDPGLLDSGSSFDFIDVNVEMFAGKDTLTVHAIERSDPQILDDMLMQFAESYAQQTDGFVADGLLAGAGTSSAADYEDAIVAGIADSAQIVRQAPEWLLLNLSGWSTLKGLRNDLDGRRVFPRLSARNAQGTMSGSPFTDGDAEGLTTRVSLNLPTGADPDADPAADFPDVIAAYPSMAGRFYEGGGTAQVRAMQVGSLTWEIGVYGYVAYLPKYPTAVRKIELA